MSNSTSKDGKHPPRVYVILCLLVPFGVHLCVAQDPMSTQPTQPALFHDEECSGSNVSWTTMGMQDNHPNHTSASFNQTTVKVEEFDDATSEGIVSTDQETTPFKTFPSFVQETLTEASTLYIQRNITSVLSDLETVTTGYPFYDEFIGITPPQCFKEVVHNLSMPTLSLSGSMMDTIEWQFEYTGRSPGKVCVWQVRLPNDYGFVVEFNRVDMMRDDFLELYTCSDSAGYVLRKKFTVKLYTSMAPLFLYDTAFCIIMHTFDDIIYPETSSFSISYTAHLNKSLPDFSVPFDENPRDSRVIYHCTGIRHLPKAITCDGIRHCDNGEDEANCSYRQKGCGEWFPHRDVCLKLIFARSLYFIPGHSKITMPVQAEEACQSDYGATLAFLPDPAGLQIVARLIRTAGFMNAVIGIKKVKPVSIRQKHLYRFLWQWGDRGSPIDYEHLNLQRAGTTLDCAVLYAQSVPAFKPVRCVLPMPPPDGFVCMRSNPARAVQSVWRVQNLTFSKALVIPDQFPTKECPDGSLVQTFHSCQWHEQGDSPTSSLWSPNDLPLFQCRYGQDIHYSLLCDGNDDCADRSDEADCHHLKYPPLLDSSYTCTNLQTIPVDQRCDGKTDCLDGSDEDYCVTCNDGIMCPNFGCIPLVYAEYFPSCPVIASYADGLLMNKFPNGSVILDGFGMSGLEFSVPECLEGFYKCHSGLCIPGFLINNGETDCWDGDDEDIPVDNITCPGYYRCQGIGSCVHKIYLCDGIYHCPNKDDERFCHMTCPRDQDCVCEGLAFTCSKMIDPLHRLHVRYLDVSHASNVSLINIHYMEYLAFLNLSFCYIGNVTLTDMPQLRVLDLRSNSLKQLASLNLYKLPRLIYINLSNNPFLKEINDAFSTVLILGEFQNLLNLILVNVSLETIEENALSPLVKLEHLDIRQNSVHNYFKGSLKGLRSLKEMYTDESKLCCSYFHTSLLQCFAPLDELSTCSNLLGQDIFRIFLWTVSLTAITGNSGVLIYRIFINVRTSSLVSSVLIKTLCASDLLMGIYMLIIGVADIKFHGNYVAKEREWLSSVACKIAGFLSFLSSEVSAFVICFITLERALVIRFPFNTRIHMNVRTALFLCCMAWVVGIALAAVPLMVDMEFYGQNGICVPLPITRRQFSGQAYAFGVFIVLNFVLFVFIGIGQVLIYRAVQQARSAAGAHRRGQDLMIARRLFLVIFTDFCCWFPIGVMGLLASTEVPIPSAVNVWAAIFVMPLNSALNPFLYTLNGLMVQWKKRRQEKRTARMLCKLKSEISNWQPASIQELTKICVQSKVVKKDMMMRWIGISVKEVLAITGKVGSPVNEADVHEDVEVSDIMSNNRSTHSTTSD